ncbi:MAG: hypothetical protein DRR08_22215 [Candidatus Parabeggiatoa sp. nov. 2]|nr:MAG: hypothetical protein DRR08_22215 [Gammaproteobacteria bacterium]
MALNESRPKLKLIHSMAHSFIRAIRCTQRPANSFIHAIRCTQRPIRLSAQFVVLSYQLSVISYQLSVISYQLSVISCWEAFNQFGIMALNESRPKLKLIHSMAHSFIHAIRCTQRFVNSFIRVIRCTQLSMIS